MITSEKYAQSAQVVGASEHSLVGNGATIQAVTLAAIVTLVLDASAMTAGDEYEIAVYEKVVTGGAQRRTVLGNLVGAQSEPFMSFGMQLGVGWDLTLKKIGGTDRAFTWSIRTVQ